MRQFLPDTAYMLIRRLLAYGDAHTFAPTAAQAADLVGNWGKSMIALYNASIQFEALHVHSTASGCDVILDRILDSLTCSPEHPDGPIHGLPSGTFAGSEYGPFPTGSPSERLAWLGLFNYCREDASMAIPMTHLAERIGSPVFTVNRAMTSLEERCIAERLGNAPYPTCARLLPIYQPPAADARVAWQRTRVRVPAVSQ